MAMALVGIARMAAEGGLLAAKREVEYFEIGARGVLNRTRPGMPFQWTINPYRGCEFGCKYCYARYTHEFMEIDAGEFESKIYAKASAAAVLQRELRRVHRRECIAIGTATDPYQPAERLYGVTRQILEVFARERGRRLSLTTKSNLVARDVELLREVARGNVLSVNFTITALDPDLARLLEPRAPRPDLRLAAARKLADAGVVVGVFPNPIMPGITDAEAQLDELAMAARNAGARWFGGGSLFLMSSARRVFLPFVEKRFPHLASRYRKLYGQSARLGPEYQKTLKARIQAVRSRYGLAAEPMDYRPELWEEEPWEEAGQPSLFPLH
jgi:DNA repair photolyase